MKQRITFASIMGIITTGIISFSLVGLNYGFRAGFFGVWFRSWSVSYLVAVVVILFVSPGVQIFVDSLMKKTELQEKRKKHHINDK
jgi:hypothetical protein